MRILTAFLVLLLGAVMTVSSLPTTSISPEAPVAIAVVLGVAVIVHGIRAGPGYRHDTISNLFLSAASTNGGTDMEVVAGLPQRDRPADLPDISRIELVV